MAVTDISEDDLDEVMREEAEDVFFADGKLARGQLRESRCGRTGGLQGRHSLRFTAWPDCWFESCGCDRG